MSRAFPLQLAPVVYCNTYAPPTVESASPTSCFARARYTPKDITYETTVRLHEGKWSIETRTASGGRVYDQYPIARGHEIALAVINWWNDAFFSRAALVPPVALARFTWLSRSSHKLLAEVGGLPEQLAALQILASSYHISFQPTGAAPTLRSATWATAANYHLERLPAEHRADAVALLIEMFVGGKLVAATEASAAA